MLQEAIKPNSVRPQELEILNEKLDPSLCFNQGVVKPYFKSQNFELYLANCLDFLAEQPENSVDMVFADPPYNLSNGGITVHAGKMVSVNKGEWDKSNGFKDDYDFHHKWMEACRRVLKPHGTLWVSGTYHSIYQCGHALQSLGYHILNDIAWFKPNASPNLSCRYFTASHETLIWARKEKKEKHIFNYDAMKNGNWPEDQLKKPGLQMRSVWSMGTPKPIEKKFGKHPTQKPEDLLKRIVLASTNKGDLVLDPFTGSSTTGIAAHLLGRSFIGIDTEKEYLVVSVKRFEELDRNMKNKIQLKQSKIVTRSEALNNLKGYIGQDLIQLARDHGITVADRHGKLSKGCKGLVLERLAGLQTNASKAPNGDTWELKSVSFHNVNGKWTPKETMAIGMINTEELKEHKFFESHCWSKIKAMIFCAVEWNGTNSLEAKLLRVASLDFTEDDDLIKEIKADYDLIRSKLINEGFEALTGSDGKWIQARTKGPGGVNPRTGKRRPITRAFYARTSLVKKIFEISI